MDGRRPAPSGIVSASRRTDIPACYAEWFFRRIRAGFADVRNPIQPRQVRRVSLRPEDLDGLVFWTRNPAPMLPRLGEIPPVPFYFQVTLTGYGPDLEPGLPDEADRVEAIRRLADRIGPDRVVWRYDPVLLTTEHTIPRRLERFADLSARLAGATRRCVISFLDPYRKIAGAMAAYGLSAPDEAQVMALAEGLSDIGRQRGLELRACAEPWDLSSFGIRPSRCIDASLLENIGGRPLGRRRDPHQRPACGCDASVDIGAYDTCPHGCVYCYANRNRATALRLCGTHDPDAPALGS